MPAVAPVWSSGGNRSRTRRSLASRRIPTGPVPSLVWAIRRHASSLSDWPRQHTAETAPVASSRATVRVTSFLPHCTGPGCPINPCPIGVTDGLRLHDTYIAAVNRCAPPANRPTPAERDACLPYLVRELRALIGVRVIVCLGAYAWDGTFRALATLRGVSQTAPKFSHGAEAHLDAYALLGSFHVSQQNTFTGRLTPEMLDGVLLRARHLSG